MRPSVFLAVVLFSALLFSTPGDARAQRGRFDTYYETQEYYDMKREDERQEVEEEEVGAEDHASASHVVEQLAGARPGQGV